MSTKGNGEDGNVNTYSLDAGRFGGLEKDLVEQVHHFGVTFDGLGKSRDCRLVASSRAHASPAAFIVAVHEPAINRGV